MDKLMCLKNRIFVTSNEDCFIERETFLSLVSDKYINEKNYFARLFSDLLDYVSVPVYSEDIFVGRVVEGKADIKQPNSLLHSIGHLTPNYNELLTKGYSGIFENIRQNALHLGTDEAKKYVENAEIVIDAVRRFALRYSESAKNAGNLKAYEALKKVPFEPAYDLYSALQSIWIVHMIASCYMGARDYAFGYMDEYLYPFYLKEKENGTSDDEIRYMLSGFMIKTNEICGRCTHNYNVKPIHCQSSKQYIMLDGGRANRLTELILDAAKDNCMAQPEITVALSEGSSDEFKHIVADAMSVLTDKLQVYNYEILRGFLLKNDLPVDIVSRPAFSACCTFDLNYHSIRDEVYTPIVKIFTDTLFENEFSNIDELKSKYSEKVTKCIEQHIESTRNTLWCADKGERCYLFDCLLNPDCNEKCSYPPEGLKYICKNILLPGIATLGNSLNVLDELVFVKKELSYSEFINCLKNDFEGYECLHKKILSLPKFGNDLEVDRYTVEMGELLINAVNAARHNKNEILIPGFYSLDRENASCQNISATPDGRKAGMPFSENQSPTYGTDKKGITALLNSVSKLPFYNAPAGGMNLTFSSNVDGDILLSLIKTYFQKGGLHMGITILDKSVLRDAMKSPEKYKSLTVRLYGFSEYFISLPVWQQEAVLNRTEY